MDASLVGIVWHQPNTLVQLECAIMSCRFDSSHTQSTEAVLICAMSQSTYRLSNIYIELCCCKVVQEEHWLSPRGDDVIHAHSYQVNANGIMCLHVKSQFELGSHTIRASH